MSREWSELNKLFQSSISKSSSFDDGIKYLLDLRKMLFDEVEKLLSINDTNQLRINTNSKKEGNNSKTIVYSVYHIFRIEDIVVSILLLRNKTDIFTENNCQKKMNSIISTTGNELDKEAVITFSKNIDVQVLLDYAKEVYKRTNDYLLHITFDNLKEKISQKAKEILESSSVVSKDEKAVWLIDYWCNKDTKGLLQMPLSRHWIMHTNSAIRLKTN